MSGLHDADFPFGKGSPRKHQGKKAVHEWINQRATTYQRAHTFSEQKIDDLIIPSRSDLITQVLDLVASSDGFFKMKALDGMWYAVDTTRARDQISKLFSEHERGRKRNASNRQHRPPRSDHGGLRPEDVPPHLPVQSQQPVNSPDGDCDSEAKTIMEELSCKFNLSASLGTSLEGYIDKAKTKSDDDTLSAQSEPATEQELSKRVRSGSTVHSVESKRRKQRPPPKETVGAIFPPELDELKKPGASRVLVIPETPTVAPISSSDSFGKLISRGVTDVTVRKDMDVPPLTMASPTTRTASLVLQGYATLQQQDAPFYYGPPPPHNPKLPVLPAFLNVAL